MTDEKSLTFLQKLSNELAQRQAAIMDDIIMQGLLIDSIGKQKEVEAMIKPVKVYFKADLEACKKDYLSDSELRFLDSDGDIYAYID